MNVAELPTPALLLDRAKLWQNVDRMRTTLAPHRVNLRPHLKTGKSLPVARIMTGGWSGAITVSTLKEAQEFLAAGFTDILYAVGITGDKLPIIAKLTHLGAKLSVILDSCKAAEQVADFADRTAIHIPVLIEIDSDGHRAGVSPDDGAAIVSIGRIVHRSAAKLHGVMTHAGGSYDLTGIGALGEHAELERASAVRAAAHLRAAGLPCPSVSVGSTPTVLASRDLSGVTEVRAGVFAFFDLVMASVGVCSTSEIALSVLTQVIGHRATCGQVIIDAGWMALSRDVGRSHLGNGYGLVCDLEGRQIPGVIVQAVNQEHGIVANSGGRPLTAAEFPLGRLLRVLPNHACATSTQHDVYQVIDRQDVVDAWPRFRGW